MTSFEGYDDKMEICENLSYICHRWRNSIVSQFHWFEHVFLFWKKNIDASSCVINENNIQNINIYENQFTKRHDE